MIGPCSPFFIVSDISLSLDHYVGLLGFECRHSAPDDEPFFAIVGRDAAQILLKTINPEVLPLPNPERHEWARWDALVHASDPDRLAAEFSNRNVPFREQLCDTDDGLRGFEVADPDGYVCFFGRVV